MQQTAVSSEQQQLRQVRKSGRTKPTSSGRSSSSSGIYALSHEVLRLVFRCLRYEVRTLEVCMQVCRAWRSVLICKAEVWSSITMDAKEETTSLSRVKRQLELVKGGGLDVSVFSFDSFRTTTWLNHVLPNASQWHTLRLLSTQKTYSNNPTATLTLSSLRTIEVANTTLLSSLPIDSMTWSNIRTLLIKKGGTPIPLSSFRNLPRLETLEMNYCTIINDSPPMETPILPCLNMCSLRGCNDTSLLLLDGGNVRRAIIERVRFPGVIRLPQLEHLEFRAYMLTDLSQMECPSLTTLVWKGAWVHSSGNSRNQGQRHQSTLPSVLNLIVESSTSADALYKVFRLVPNVRYLRIAYPQEDKTLSQGDIDSLIEMMDTGCSVSEPVNPNSNPVTQAKMFLEGLVRRPKPGEVLVCGSVEVLELMFSGLSQTSRQTLRSFTMRVLRARAALSCGQMRIVCKWSMADYEVIE